MRNYEQLYKQADSIPVFQDNDELARVKFDRWAHELAAKIDQDMDNGLSNKEIQNLMKTAGFDSVIILDVILHVEKDRAKRTTLGKLLYE